VLTSKGRGKGRKGKRERRGWKGEREEGEGKGKDDLHPTLFLGPDFRSVAPQPSGKKVKLTLTEVHYALSNEPKTNSIR